MQGRLYLVRPRCPSSFSQHLFPPGATLAANTSPSKFRCGSSRNYSDEDASSSTIILAVTSTTEARQLLGLPVERSRSENNLTAKELRLAYYKAAKDCHPDVQASTKTKAKNQDSAERFRLVTDAYELLQRKSSGKEDDDTCAIIFDDDISLQDEADYRTACQNWLGQPAEIVEESKRCPAFRQWLAGRTDAAVTWNQFFMLHGGLAPRLMPRQLGMSSDHKLPAHNHRRKRPGRN